MRYSKWALLLFGAGALLGLAVVSAGLPKLGRVASLAMAAGIVLLPVGFIADWRRRTAPKPTIIGGPRRGPLSARAAR